MLLAGKPRAQVLREPLGLLNDRRLVLIGQAFANGNPAGVGLNQCGLLKVRKLFCGSKQCCTRASAEIEQAGNFSLSAQLEFSKNSAQGSVCCRQSHGEISGAMRFRGNGRSRKVSGFIVLSELRRCLSELAAVYFVD